MESDGTSRFLSVEPPVTGPHRLIHVLRMAGSVGIGAAAAAVASRGYPGWYVITAMSCLVFGDAAFRLSRPNLRASLRAPAVDLTALGVTCLLVGIAGFAFAAPLAYAAAAVIVAGGLSRRTAGLLVYGATWSIALAGAAASSISIPNHPVGLISNLSAQGAFLVVIAVTLVLHGRLSRQVRDYREAARDATERKAEFLRNISHEIRTPMNGILGMADLLVESELDEDHLHQVAIIRSSGFELLSLINDLLDLSWLEAGEVEIEAAPFDPRDTLGSLLETFLPQARDKGVELDLHIAGSVPHLVVADPGRFRQVVSVLVSNAVKFTHEGAVWVRVGIQGDANPVLRVSVADTGVGMSDAQKQTVFDIFAQSDGTLTRQHGGTGIGLAIAARLTQLMGGMLRVESELDFGSTFHLSLPVTVAAEPDEAPSPAADWGAKRVLLICDGDGLSDRFASALEHAGFHVERACEIGVLPPGQVAGADAIVFDVGADLAAVGRMRELHPHTAPVIVITSSGQRGDSSLARQLGVAGYLTRPLGSDDLVRAAMTVVGNDYDPLVSPLITVHSLREGRSQVRVLVADDSPTNRAIAALALRRRGYVITEVADGSQALAEFQHGEHDVILMDIQMPVMDGLEATRRIRELERSLDRRTPIIALTAHALRADRDRANEAGLDAYLTKPLRIDALVEAIETHLPPADEIVGGPAPPVLDTEALRAQLGDDDQAVREVIDLFRSDLPQHVATIRDGLAGDDPDVVQGPAHRLKGELGVLCAPGPHAAATELDAAAKSGDWGRMEAAWDELESELKRLDTAFDALLG